MGGDGSIRPVSNIGQLKMCLNWYSPSGRGNAVLLRRELDDLCWCCKGNPSWKTERNGPAQPQLQH